MKWLADARTEDLLATGDDQLIALTGGYHAAFIVGAFAATATAVGAAFRRAATVRGEMQTDSAVSTEPAHASAAGRD